MARSDKRYSVYPVPKAIEVVGDTAPALNQAIECWAALLTRSIADNANRTFSLDPESFGTCVGHLTGRFEDYHDLHEWALLADVTKHVRFDPEFPNPGELLATAVEDADRLEDVGEKWFASSFDGEEYAKGLEHKVKALVKKLRDLDYPHAWAVITTVQWFWQHQGAGIDIRKDPWWTLAFRRQWHRRTAGKKSTRRTRKSENGKM